MPPVYKHVAPLGLNASRFLVFWFSRCFHYVSRITHHVPHVAPLGLKNQNGTDSVASQPWGVLLMPIDGRFLPSCALR